MFAVFFYHQTYKKKKIFSVIFFWAKNEKFLSEKRLLNPSENKNSQALDIESIGHNILRHFDQFWQFFKDFKLFFVVESNKTKFIAKFRIFFLII